MCYIIYFNVEYVSDEDEEDEFKIDFDGKECRYFIWVFVCFI